MKGKDIAAGGVGFQKICEAGFDPGTLIAEWQRPFGGRQRVRKPLTIFCSLPFKPGESAALFFRFHDSKGLTVHIQKVVGFTEARLHRKFANGDAASRSQVDILTRLHDPTSSRQTLVNVFPCSGFGGFGHGLTQIIARTAVTSLVHCLEVRSVVQPVQGPPQG